MLERKEEGGGGIGGAGSMRTRVVHLGRRFFFTHPWPCIVGRRLQQHNQLRVRNFRFSYLVNTALRTLVSLVHLNLF